MEISLENLYVDIGTYRVKKHEHSKGSRYDLKNIRRINFLVIC